MTSLVNGYGTSFGMAVSARANVMTVSTDVTSAIQNPNRYVAFARRRREPDDSGDPWLFPGFSS